MYMDFSTSYDYETGFVPSKNMATDNFIRSLVALWEEPATYVRQFVCVSLLRQSVLFQRAIF